MISYLTTSTVGTISSNVLNKHIFIWESLINGLLSAVPVNPIQNPPQSHRLLFLLLVILKLAISTRHIQQSEQTNQPYSLSGKEKSASAPSLLKLSNLRLLLATHVPLDRTCNIARPSPYAAFDYYNNQK